MIVSDEALWPVVCGACGYSLHGLPEPRCPECGERVEQGEVVIVGTPVNGARTFTGEPSLGKELAAALLIAGGAGAIAMITRPIESKAAVAGAGAMMVFLAMIIFVRWLVLRSHGWPEGVVRMCALGFVFGAGDTEGSPRAWPRRVQAHIRARGRGVVMIRIDQMLGPVPLRTLVEIYAACDEKQVEGIAERLREWCGAVVRVRG